MMVLHSDKRTGLIKTFFILLLSFAGVITLDGQYPGLLPAPKESAWGSSKFMLTGTAIVASPELMTREGKAITDLSLQIEKKTGSSPEIKYLAPSTVRSIALEVDEPGNPLAMPGEISGPGSRESYSIKVNAGEVTVHSRTDAGLSYALTTLGQMIMGEGADCFIPEAEITDYPDMAYRGVMIDFSHGGLPREEEIKDQIDFLSRWKINQYYFYNEVSIEMSGYPLINYGGSYSREQIKRIIAYGRLKHVDVIPFVNFYGHLHELLRIEKYSGLGIGNYGHDLDPRDPGVRKVLGDWIGQYADIFPSPFIHIGFDETWETERLKAEDPSINPRELYMMQLNFVAGTLKGYGKKVMLWTDISGNYPDIISGFPKDVIPVLWEYSDTPSSMNKWLKPVENEKLPFFVQSAVDSWGNVYPAADYTFDNIDICLKTCSERKAIGYITSVWTDAVQPLLRNTWLFMAYGTSGAWNRKGVKRDTFIDDYCRIVYPDIADITAEAFRKMEESEEWLAGSLGRHTLNQMWEDPFSSYHLKNTALHLNDYKNARIAAETALEKLSLAMNTSKSDSAFIRTLMVNCRQLDYTASRYLWARTIVDRWNWIYEIRSKGEKDYIMHYDINYSTHGLIVDMMDYCTSLKEEYRKAWISENMEYRLGTITGRFDAEYLQWHDLYSKIGFYIRHNEDKGTRQKFEKVFLNNR